MIRADVGYHHTTRRRTTTGVYAVYGDAIVASVRDAVWNGAPRVRQQIRHDLKEAFR